MIRSLRLAAIEYLALWEGALSAQRLGKLVGLSREQAQRTLIGPYRREMPGRLVSVGKGPSKIDPDGPSTKWMPSDPGGFIAVLTGLKAIASRSPNAWPLDGDFESVPLTCRANSENEPFVALHRAMCARRSVDIEYRAKRGLRTYRFSPHTLIDTGNRPHFRGYAVEPLNDDGYFLDLIPARVMALGDTSNAYVSADADDRWRNRVDLTFTLRHDMDESLKDAISVEFHLHKGEITIFDVREALAMYVIRYFVDRRVEGRDLPIFRYAGSRS